MDSRQAGDTLWKVVSPLVTRNQLLCRLLQTPPRLWPRAARFLAEIDRFRAVVLQRRSVLQGCS
jgi:hypothetical protein